MVSSLANGHLFPEFGVILDFLIPGHDRVHWL